MLLDRNTWNLIGGFPENTVWTHSDYIVCKVVHNHRIALTIPLTSIFTYEQPEKNRVLSTEEMAIVKSYEFLYRCNSKF